MILELLIILAIQIMILIIVMNVQVEIPVINVKLIMHLKEEIVLNVL